MLDKKEKESKSGIKTRNALATMSLVTEIGITMVANVVIGFLAGMYMDRWLNTAFLFLLIGTLLGMMSGFRMVYLQIMKLERRGTKNDETT